MGNVPAKEGRSRANTYLSGSSQLSSSEVAGYLNRAAVRRNTINTPSSVFSHTPLADLKRAKRQEEKDRQRELHYMNLIVRYAENVDGGYLAPFGTYKSNLDYNTEVVRGLIIDRRLSPFYTPLQDFDESWTEEELLIILSQLPLHSIETAYSEDEEEDDVDNHKIHKSSNYYKRQEQKAKLKSLIERVKELQKDEENRFVEEKAKLKKLTAHAMSTGNSGTANTSYFGINNSINTTNTKNTGKSKTSAGNTPNASFDATNANSVSTTNTGATSSNFSSSIANSTAGISTTSNIDNLTSTSATINPIAVYANIATGTNTITPPGSPLKPSKIANDSISLEIPSRDLLLKLYRKATECPICFLYYPKYLNVSRCCLQPICTECFVQIKRLDPHPPHDDSSNQPGSEELPHTLISEAASCPYCALPDFGVTYDPPRLISTGINGAIKAGQYTDPYRAIPEDIEVTSSPDETPRIPIDEMRVMQKGANANGRRRASLAANAPGVIHVDAIRPDWEHKLTSARNKLARKAATASAIHASNLILNDDEDDVPTSSSGGRRRFSAPTNDPNSRRRPSANGTSNHLRTVEERMIEEALRLSIIDEEERKKKVEVEQIKKNRK